MFRGDGIDVEQVRQCDLVRGIAHFITMNAAANEEGIAAGIIGAFDIMAQGIPNAEDLSCSPGPVICNGRRFLSAACHANGPGRPFPHRFWPPCPGTYSRCRPGRR